MKRFIIAIIVVLTSASYGILNAQNVYYPNGKIGYINTDSILVKIPAYETATTELIN